MAMQLQAKLIRMAIGALCVLTGTAILAPGPLAQTFPSKLTTIIVPSPAGGGPDIWARILAEKLHARLGQIVVENRPGAGGLTGASVVARAAPDGHTLLVAANTLGTAAHIFARTGSGGVDVKKDLAPFLTLGISPAVIVVKTDLGVKSLHELVALAKRPPGLTYASSGTGTLLHMAGELFSQSAGIKMTHVPYPGFSQAITDLIGGRVDVLFTGYAAVAQHLKAGSTSKIMALAIINDGRSALAPDIPTLEEQGYKNVDAVGWYGVYAPAATPPAVIGKLNQDINAILKLPDVQERGVSTGLELAGGTPQEAAARYSRDYEVFGKVIKETGITQQ